MIFKFLVNTIKNKKAEDIPPKQAKSGKVSIEKEPLLNKK